MGNSLLQDDPIELSRKYYSFADEFTQSSFEDNKLLGKYYTDKTVARNMMEVLCQTMKVRPFETSLRIIDPFCGDGRLVVTFLETLLERKEYEGYSFNIDLWDIDKDAVAEARNNVEAFSHEVGIKAEIKTSCEDAYVQYRPLIGTYDVCITNPPWGLLKPLKIFNKSNDEAALKEYRSALEMYDEYMKSEFEVSLPSAKFGKWGTNLGRCGVEVALKLIKYDGYCGIVSPASLLNDQISSRLRDWIFKKFKVVDVSYYPAELKLYGKADVTSVTVVIKGGETDPSLELRTYSSRTEYRQKRIEKAIFEYIRKQHYALPLKTGVDSIPVMMYLDGLPTTLDYVNSVHLSFTREMDETKFKEKLKENGDIIFAKGYMVDRYTFTEDGLFLNEEMFAPPVSVNCPKIVWRDVSRDSQLRRMKATLLSPGYVCGNSLGVIYSPEKDVEYLKMLTAIMNSTIFEYQARSMLVSNHVAAGIVKQIHVPHPVINKRIIELVDRQLNGEDLEAEIDLEVAKLYEISPDGYETIINSFRFEADVKKKMIDAYRNERKEIGDNKNLIYNHYASTLSELDMQIIKCVPPGGNWKDIPESVPSHRLEQIRESYKAGKGSRSTYYGRLRPEKPSYTINTYFNRPGNGCNMHYEQDRTLSQREAARFQSFPDTFEFIGSKVAVNNQIGNAVPPLLAYQIAKQIPFTGQFVDLFCGAGGLALGFIWAGWTPIIGNDIDNYAIETHKRNINSNAICGDINSDEVHDTIVSNALAAKAARPNLPLFVLGGPPCQGFSTANTRRGTDDLRNWLFKSYVKIVNAIQPEGFVFENVRGILNLDKGQFFEMIKGELKECVEDIKVNQISAANYGVPQRRDRVIIIGGKKVLVDSFYMQEISCVPKNGQIDLLPTVIGAEDAIGDLPPLEPGQDGSDLPYRFPAANEYQKFMRGEISADDYLDIYKNATH